MKKAAITDNRLGRGITFLPHGQQFHGYLPKGEYTYTGTVNLQVSSLGKVDWHRVARLFHEGEKTAWYVGIEFARTTLKLTVED